MYTEPGINRVQISCSRGSVGFERLGDVLENEVPNHQEENVLVQRYWIDLS